MKSERRHELQQNALAAWITEQVEHTKPYASWIVGGIIAGVLIAMVVAFQRGESRHVDAESWDEYYTAASAGDTDALQEIAARTAGTRLGTIAGLTLADITLAEGARQAAIDRSQAQTKFEQAAANYESVANAADDDLLRNRGWFGRGQALEWLMQLDKAQEAYEQVTGPLARQAQQRVADLRRRQTREFYEAYAAHTPRPPIDPAGLSPDFDLGSPLGPSDFDLLEQLGPDREEAAPGAGLEGLLPDLGAPFGDLPAGEPADDDPFDIPPVDEPSGTEPAEALPEDAPQQETGDPTAEEPESAPAETEEQTEAEDAPEQPAAETP